MIKVFLRGGLGNQLFQYALGFHLARKNNTELMLDTTFLNDTFPRRQFTYRTFDLDVFTAEYKTTVFSKISKHYPIPGVWLGIDIACAAIQGMVGSTKLVIEKNEKIFDERIVQSPANTTLWGRWQHEWYFRDSADELRKQLQFRDPIVGEAQRVQEEIMRANAVGVHIRRGDYVATEKMKKIVGDTNLAYYEKATKYIQEQVKDPHFFIFSDDSEWCKKNIHINAPVTILDQRTAGPKNAFHLHLMALCKHMIIANSTFSWWGGWLNQNKKPIIIAPRAWIGFDLPHSLVPNGWIIMEKN